MTTEYVLWTKRNNLRLQVLGEVSKHGERWLEVCKDTCPNPSMGQFRVRVSEVVPA